MKLSREQMEALMDGAPNRMHQLARDYLRVPVIQERIRKPAPGQTSADGFVVATRKLAKAS